MLKHAFKEWAVICRALAEGRQALILRKGGIAESGGQFALAQTRFWLFPTYLHQKPDALKPEARPLLEAVEAERPPTGTVRLSHFAQVDGAYHVQDIVGALRIDSQHLWTRETVAKRFEYRSPGLYVLPVRAYRVAEPFEIPDTAYYAGCKSWVELEKELPTAGAVPVLDDDAFRDVVRTLELLLQPRAIV
jgi:hypothetical protein